MGAVVKEGRKEGKGGCRLYVSHNAGVEVVLLVHVCLSSSSPHTTGAGALAASFGCHPVHTSTERPSKLLEWKWRLARKRGCAQVEAVQDCLCYEPLLVPDGVKNRAFLVQRAHPLLLLVEAALLARHLVSNLQ